jgi:hypothetical protein
MADETTNSEDAVSFNDAMDFLSERIQQEEAQFDEEVPDHAPALIVDEATALLQTATSIEMAHEMAGEDDDVDEDGMMEALEEDAVNVITALAALQYEHGLDIATAVEDRMDFIEDYREFENAMEDAEGRDEQMEVMDELLTDEIAEELGMGEMGEAPKIGESVDREGYDHDEEGKGFQ